MDNNQKKITFCISEIPDPAFSQFQAVAGGNVSKTIWQGWEHILRILSNMPASSVSIELMYVFDPSPGQGDSQSRLKIYLRINANDTDTLASLEHLIGAGTLSRFYELSKIDDLSLKLDALNYTCSVIRREDFIKPLHSSMFNAKVPNCYYSLLPFEPNEKNDFLMLDRVLDRISEPVIICVKVEPVDISREFHAFTQYLENLISINRCYEDDYESDSLLVDQYFSDNDDFSNLCPSTESLKALNYRDPLADEMFRLGRKNHESLRKPYLKFQISVSTQSAPTASLMASVIAESAFKNGSYRLISSNDDQKSDISLNSHNNTTNENLDVSGYDDLRLLIRCATVDEIVGMVRCPVASFSSPYCIRRNTDPGYIDPDDLIVLGYDVHGQGKDGKPIPRGIHLDAITKHFVSLGMSGYGKTTNNMNILIQLWERGIPFMAIESVKTEYRSLKKFSNHEDPDIRKLAKYLHIYTADSKTSPFDFNPLDFPGGITVNEHIENLLVCLKATVSVSAGSLPALLGEAFEQVYEQFPEPSNPPTMSDLVAMLKTVLDSKAYTSETRSDMLTAIEVRLGVLTQRLIGDVFGFRKGISINNLLKVPSIIEMDRLTVEQKCLLTLFILNAIREVLRSSPSYTGPLRLVILIEEAHNVFGSLTNHNVSEDTADPRSHVVEFLSQMMVELRALGVAIILSDQHPSNLASGAIKTPVSKLAFLQVDSQDREILGNSMLFNSSEMQDIARLRIGEGFFYTEGYHYPRRIQTVNLHDRINLSEPLSDQQLHRIISTEDWFKTAAKRRLHNRLSQFKDCMDRLSMERKQLNQDIQKCIGLRERFKDHKNCQARNNAMSTIISNLRMKNREFSDSYKDFGRNVNKKFEDLREQKMIKDKALKTYSEILFKRLDSSLIPCVEELLSSLDNTIKSCIKIRKKE